MTERTLRPRRGLTVAKKAVEELKESVAPIAAKRWSDDETKILLGKTKQHSFNHIMQIY